jgi:hypothetical protein
MEGGAHVVMEAVCSGTPVLASAHRWQRRHAGRDYAGYLQLRRRQGLAAAALSSAGPASRAGSTAVCWRRLAASAGRARAVHRLPNAPPCGNWSPAARHRSTIRLMQG